MGLLYHHPQDSLNSYNNDVGFFTLKVQLRNPNTIIRSQIRKLQKDYSMQYTTSPFIFAFSLFKKSCTLPCSAATDKRHLKPKPPL